MSEISFEWYYLICIIGWWPNFKIFNNNKNLTNRSIFSSIAYDSPSAKSPSRMAGTLWRGKRSMNSGFFCSTGCLTLEQKKMYRIINISEIGPTYAFSFHCRIFLVKVCTRPPHSVLFRVRVCLFPPFESTPPPYLWTPLLRLFAGFSCLGDPPKSGTLLKTWRNFRNLNPVFDQICHDFQIK